MTVVWRMVILLGLGVFNVVLFSRVIWGSTGLLEYRELKSRHEELKAEIARLDADNLAISREIRLLQTDGQYMEKVIRQRLHYVRDGEILYIFAKSPDKAARTKGDERKN